MFKPNPGPRDVSWIGHLEGRMRKGSFLSLELAEVSVVVGRHVGTLVGDILVNPDTYLCSTALVPYGMGRETGLGVHLF